jgi:hypothetical protein
MLQIITDISNPLLDFIRDDPVRPEIPVEFRVSGSRFVAALVEEKLQAMVCVSLHDFVPDSVEGLACEPAQPTTAIFYTIWSYVSGTAAQLIFDTVDAIQEMYPTVNRFITLSPKTDMAYKFHIRNGAVVLRENENTVNYEYILESL